MRLRNLLAAAFALAAVSTFAVERASANPIVLTFEGLQNEEGIGNYYNGGTGSDGSGPGPNYGISFGADSLALISDQDGGSGNFSGQPSGSTVAFFLSGPGDVMDVAAGFNTGFSFYYADQVGFTGNVTVWSGLDGTGTELASLSLAPTPNPYTVWEPTGVAFTGTAESVIFGGSANYIAFDNITLGSASAGGVPEPATWAMMLMGFFALGAGVRGARRRTAALAA